MRRFGSVVFSAGLLAIVAGAVQAADIARLEWGAFVVEADSSNGMKEWKALSSDDGRSVTLTFEALEALADGVSLAAKASLSGYFDIDQPERDGFTHLRAEVSGYVIKSADAKARIILRIGNSDHVIDWPAAMAMSEKFSKTIDVYMDGSDRLPDPFAVSVETQAEKSVLTDASFVSVNSIRIAADNPKLAER